MCVSECVCVVCICVCACVCARRLAMETVQLNTGQIVKANHSIGKERSVRKGSRRNFMNFLMPACRHRVEGCYFPERNTQHSVASANSADGTQNLVVHSGA